MTRTYLSLQVIKNVALPDMSPSLKGCDIERGLCQCCRLPPAPKDAGFRLAIIMSADYELFGGSLALDRHQQEDGMYLNYLNELEEELGVTTEQVVDDVEFVESSDER